MGIKARIEKLEKHAPPDAPHLPFLFYEFYDASGEKRLSYRGPGGPPASQEDLRRAEQQAAQRGCQVLILRLPPGTKIIPGRMSGKEKQLENTEY
jgi:hypothetical protein